MALLSGLVDMQYIYGYKTGMNDRPRLPPNQQLIRSQRWPVVGESAPRTGDDSEWTVTVAAGSVERKYSIEQLQALGVEQRTLDIHCVTRWSRYDVAFGGIPLSRIVGFERLDPSLRFVSFVARSDRAHSTSLPIDVARNLDCLVAFTAEGEPLSTDHGGPVRMVVPGRYFYKSLKWLERIELLSEDRLGYWEADAGYHNEADPWQEQRYIAGGLSKQQAAKLISSRNFNDQDLLSLCVPRHDLTGLEAKRALLRNADFYFAKLNEADFSEANLSNARFVEADLRDVKFTGADLDGADFSAADLRGADLRVASMFGTSFATIAEDGTVSNPAKFDETTLWNPKRLDALTADQRKFVESCLDDKT